MIAKKFVDELYNHAVELGLVPDYDGIGGIRILCCNVGEDNGYGYNAESIPRWAVSENYDDLHYKSKEVCDFITKYKDSIYVIPCDACCGCGDW